MSTENKEQLIAEFIGSDAKYYQQQFKTIGASASFSWTFNWIAALLGPIWYGARALWSWALPLLILETFGFIQLGRALFGDLASEARERITQIEGTLAFRHEQLAAAIEKEAANVDVFHRTIESLEVAIVEIRLEVATAEASAIWVALAGVGILLIAKLLEGSMANQVLERRFSDWLSNRELSAGLHPTRTLMSVMFCLLAIAACVLQYALPNAVSWLGQFPTDPNIRLTAIAAVETFFAYVIESGQWFFDIITYGIRTVLDGLEVLFVDTPWPVIIAFIALLTWLSAGPRAAIASCAFLAYMGFLGFWDKAMTTLALLGTAACISIAIGIPIGLFCAHRPRLYAAIRPIMDFMQTMPAFVFMIPVIAFFGTGKPAAVVTTMIFGGTPVIRLTVLGMRGVPESIREAAIAFGASKWYLLRKVDLPLAAPSILAGVNQTIMLSLAMVVVASLIGAKGLGEDVLEALQYASVGQGILAGFAILFCAMILDRVIQGRRE